MKVELKDGRIKISGETDEENEMLIDEHRADMRVIYGDDESDSEDMGVSNPYWEIWEGEDWKNYLKAEDKSVQIRSKSGQEKGKP